MYSYFQEYMESVPQDLPLGSEVMRVSAIDVDDGNNSVVHYSLVSKKTDDSDPYFRIDINTGVIFLNKTLDVSNLETFFKIYNLIIILQCSEYQKHNKL